MLVQMRAGSGKPKVYEALVKMSVNPFGVDARSFDVREGWEEVGRIRRVGWKVGRWVDVMFFQKNLHPCEENPESRIQNPESRIQNHLER